MIRWHRTFLMNSPWRTWSYSQSLKEGISKARLARSTRLLDVLLDFLGDVLSLAHDLSPADELALHGPENTRVLDELHCEETRQLDHCEGWQLGKRKCGIGQKIADFFGKFLGPGRKLGGRFKKPFRQATVHPRRWDRHGR